MKQIIQAVQSFITKGKFIFFIGTVFLFVSTTACAQVIASADEQAETVPESLWPEQEKVTPSIKSELPFNNQGAPYDGARQGPPYGTIVVIQKSVNCNNTPVIKNYIQNTGGMAPVTFGTNKNEMGAITSLIQVYLNPINKRFAIIEHFATQRSCILSHGYDFEIILPSLPQEMPN